MTLHPFPCTSVKLPICKIHGGDYNRFVFEHRLYWWLVVGVVLGMFLILPWNWLNMLLKASKAVTGLIWWMLHFSFASGVVSTTMLSFKIPVTLWSKTYDRLKVPFWWPFTNANWPIFRSEALVTYLLAAGWVLLFSASNLVWSFHIFLSSCTASQPGWFLLYLQ